MIERFHTQRSFSSEEIGRGPFMPSQSQIESGDIDESVKRIARMKRAFENFRRMRSDES